MPVDQRYAKCMGSGIILSKMISAWCIMKCNTIDHRMSSTYRSVAKPLRRMTKNDLHLHQELGMHACVKKRLIESTGIGMWSKIHRCTVYSCSLKKAMTIGWVTTLDDSTYIMELKADTTNITMSVTLSHSNSVMGRKYSKWCEMNCNTLDGRQWCSWFKSD